MESIVNLNSFHSEYHVNLILGLLESLNEKQSLRVILPKEALRVESYINELDDKAYEIVSKEIDTKFKEYFFKKQDILGSGCCGACGGA